MNIFKHTAKKIRKLNEQIKFYLKCMVPPLPKPEYSGILYKLNFK